MRLRSTIAIPRSSLPILVALVAWLTNACGDGGDAATRSVGEGGDRPGREMDGGGAADDGSIGGDAAAVEIDAALPDAGVELDLPDGSTILDDGGGVRLPDGSVISVEEAERDYGPEPDVTRCQLGEGAVWRTDVGFDSDSGFALVPGPVGFKFLLRATDDMGCGQSMAAAHIGSSQASLELHALLPDCHALGDVALTPSGGDFQVAWVDNRTGSAELHSARLDDELQWVDDEPRRLTDNPHGLERRPLLAEIGGRPLLAWVTRDTQTRGESVSLQWLDGDAAPVAAVTEDEGHEVLGLALSPVGADRALLAWAGATSNPGAWLLRVTAEGTPEGPPLRLSARAGASSSIDLAQHRDGAGVVYSIEIDGQPQVRFRRLDHVGQPVGDERVVIGPPLRARDASLFSVAGGYAIAYRALPGGSVGSPELRVVFVSKDGEVIRDPSGSPASTLLAPATDATARTRVSVSVEGNLVVGWLDAGESSRRNALKLVRPALGCR